MQDIGSNHTTGNIASCCGHKVLLTTQCLETSHVDTLKVRNFVGNIRTGSHFIVALKGRLEHPVKMLSLKISCFQLKTPQEGGREGLM